VITVTLYSREECHLCAQAHDDLISLQEDIPHQLNIIDVDSTRELQRAFRLEVPVVEAGPYRLKAPFTKQELLVTLGAAQDRQRQMESKADQVPALTQNQVPSWNFADRFAYWFSRHYMFVINFFVLVYVGLPFLAPVLMKTGVESPARLIYRGYGLVCHQLAYRSFFLFGEQIIYPREAAEVEGFVTFGSSTGIGESNSVGEIFAARNFVGDDVVGYKVALCQRDVAIYFGILAFGILFVLSGRRIPALPWYLWVLIGMVPIGLDGLSQLLSQPPFTFWDYRESTPYLRVLTGFLFGFTTAWFGFPLVEETMSDSRQIMATKKIRYETSIKEGQVAD
jgi:uncharacterized membrane protein